MTDIDYSKLLKVLPPHTPPELERKARDEIEIIELMAKVRPSTKHKEANKRQAERARAALAKAIAYCREPSLVAFLAMRQAGAGGMYAQFAPTEPAVRAMKVLHDKLNRALEIVPNTAKTDRADPYWYVLVPRLQDLYTTITKRRATLNHKGSGLTPATKFVAGMLELSGIDAKGRAVACYPRRAKTK